MGARRVLIGRGGEGRCEIWPRVSPAGRAVPGHGCCVLEVISAHVRSSKRLKEAFGGIDGVLARDDCQERSVETERGEEAQDASGVAGEH